MAKAPRASWRELRDALNAMDEETLDERVVITEPMTQEHDRKHWFGWFLVYAKQELVDKNGDVIKEGDAYLST